MVSNEDIPLRKAAEEFAAKYGTRTYPVCMNLAVPDAAVRLHEFCRDRGFTVDILVNNAGVFYFEQVVDVPVDRVELMLTLHVTTPPSRVYLEYVIRLGVVTLPINFALCVHESFS